MIKLRDSRTMQITWQDRRHVNQGIFIDIFPFDSVAPFSEKENVGKFSMIKELYLATNFPRMIRDALEKNKPTLVARSELETIINLPFRERALRFDAFLSTNPLESNYVSEIRSHCTRKETLSFRLKDFEETVYLPFETIEIPAPKNYDSVLRENYGNWRQFNINNIHSNLWSADIPYYEYYRTSALIK